MAGGGDVARDAASGCDCKVGRTSRRYGLTGLDDALRRRHDAGSSLRDLERFVNEAVLEQAVKGADIAVIGTIESVLDTLTRDDASAGERTEVRDRLAAAGVDPDGLESDFVSYQTIRTHLRECLEVETGTRGEFTTEDARGTIEWSRTRNVAVIERTLDRLRGRGELETGPLEVSGVLRVTCSACGATDTVDGMLDRGRCDCEDPG